MPLKVSHGAIRSQRTRALLPSADAFSGLSDQKGEHALSRAAMGRERSVLPNCRGTTQRSVLRADGGSAHHKGLLTEGRFLARGCWACLTKAPWDARDPDAL